MLFDLNLIDSLQVAAVPPGEDAPAFPAKAATTTALADLFDVPPPLPDPAVGRRERRKVRRRAQYDARRNANLCVTCGKAPPPAAHLSRCTPCLTIQMRSASRRKGNSQSTAHAPQTHLDTPAPAPYREAQ